jgi:hypothetical protein
MVREKIDFSVTTSKSGNRIGHSCERRHPGNASLLASEIKSTCRVSAFDEKNNYIRTPNKSGNKRDSSQNKKGRQDSGLRSDFLTSDCDTEELMRDSEDTE